MIILQINFCTRTIEKVYKSLNEIDLNEYDINKVIKCCKGEIASYGGKYSENGIWRFANDIPYLKPNYDFNDKDCILSKISNPGNIDTFLENNFLYAYFDNSLVYNVINYQIQYKNINKIKNKFKKASIIRKNNNNNNVFKNGIVQIKDNYYQIYPDFSCIPETLYDKTVIYPVLKNKIIEYNGFFWMKYTFLYNFYNKIFNFYN